MSIRLQRIILIAYFDWKNKYIDNQLGLLWALIKPMFQIAIYYFVFGLIMSTDIENFALFLYSGFIPFLFFSEVTGGALALLRTKKPFYESTNMSKLDIFYSHIVTCFFGFLVNIVAFTIWAFFLGLFYSYTLLYLPLVLIVLILMSLGFGLILASLHLYVRDISQLWGYITMLLMFTSPIFFRGEKITKNFPWFNTVHPLSGLVVSFRAILFEGVSPDWAVLGQSALYAVVVLAIGVFVFNRSSQYASELTI